MTQPKHPRFRLVTIPKIKLPKIKLAFKYPKFKNLKLNHEHILVAIVVTAVVLSFVLILVYSLSNKPKSSQTASINKKEASESARESSESAQPNSNMLVLTSPQNSGLIATSSALISAQTEPGTLNIIAGCDTEKEVAISSQDSLSYQCSLKEGLNNITVANIDSQQHQRRADLNLFYTPSQLTENLDYKYSLLGSLRELNQDAFKVSQGSDTYDFRLGPQTKIVDDKLSPIQSSDLRIAGIILVIYNKQEGTLYQPGLIIQFPASYSVVNRSIIYSTFKEVIGTELILPNLDDKTQQPYHILMPETAKAVTPIGDTTPFEFIKFGTRVVSFGHMDPLGRVVLDTLHLIDPDWKSPEVVAPTSSTPSATPSAESN